MMTPLFLTLAQAALLAAAPQSVPADPASTHAVPADAVSVETTPTTYAQSLVHARELATSGDKDAAIALYTSMLAASPGNSDLLLGRGRTYAWMGQWPQSEADLQAVTAANPDYADAWSALGDMYLWSDRPTQAVEAYARWAELRPDDPAATVALARAQRSAGDLAAARGTIQAAGARGLDPAQVDDFLATLQPRTDNPEAVVPKGYRWSLRVGAEHTTFSPSSRDAWTDEVVALRRHFEHGSIALEMLHADRFGSSDTAWALDGYAPLWSRAYANLRYQRGPEDGLFADRSWRVEVFQGVGQGWELSGSYDRLEFGSSGVDIYGAGVGRYVGNWYLRYRALHVPGVGSGSLSHRGLARYYYAGNADDYVEVTAGTGRREESDTGIAAGTIQRSSNAFGVAYVRFLNPRWGFKVGANVANNVDGGFDEQSVSASIYTRW
jgi:YaiO family outer membrane protein